MDTRLPCGGRRAPGIFHRVSQSVKSMMAKHGFTAVVVYLDDFLVVGKTQAECLAAFEYLLQLLRDLGFSISWRKVVKPTTRLIFLGIELDTVRQCMSLPASKLVELQDLVTQFQKCVRASKRQLQQLADKLNWACRVVYGGRTFLRRILDTMNLLVKPSAQCKLTPDFYADIQWWCDFLQTFNGKHLFLSQNRVEVATDACPMAARAVFSGDWLYNNFGCESPTLSALHINHKEALAVCLAAERWAPAWANRQVFVFCDNQAAVGMINKGSTSSPLVMQALRRLSWLSAVFNFRLKMQYLPGSLNVIADAVSRLHSTAHLLYFCGFLLGVCGLSANQLWHEGLTGHMPYASSLFLSIRYRS